MAFMRRKSGVYHEDIVLESPELSGPEEVEPHRRRRLSKPMTSSSVTDLQYIARRKSLNRTSQTEPTQSNESREAIRSHLFSSTSDLELDKPKPKTKRSTVALMAMKFESKSLQSSASQQSLISQGLPERPINLKRSSQDRFTMTNATDFSSTSSQEEIVEDSIPPPRRTASFTPGMATRIQSRPPSIIDEGIEPYSPEAMPINSAKGIKKQPQIKVEDQIQAASHPARPGTPLDLEYTSIGGIGFGSLRVMNGTQSPAPSEVLGSARPIWAPTMRRETSSVYPESEIGTVKSRKSVKSDWEDEPLPKFIDDELVAAVRREFSFRPGSEHQFNGRRPSTPPLQRSFSATSTTDNTNKLANSYRDGIATSPFAEQETPSVEDAPFRIPFDSSPIPSFHPQDQESDSMMPASDTSTPQSQSSVRHHADKVNSRRSFIDEVIEESPIPPRSYTQLPIQPPERRDTPSSFFSVLEPGNEIEDQFISALELQPSESRSASPRKGHHAMVPSTLHGSRPVPSRSTTTKSDSGYSSNTSFSTILAANKSTEGEIVVEQPLRGKKSLRFPFRKPVNKTGKPVLVKPTPSTRHPDPNSANIESASLSVFTSSVRNSIDTFALDPTVSLPASPTKMKEKARKKLTKQRRRSTADVAKELVIHKLASIEVMNVPDVPKSARDSLAMKSQAVPELQATYATHERTSHTSNASSLTLPTRVFEFPAASEEVDHRQGRSSARSRSRKRSISRPRTWFGRSKDKEADSGKSEKLKLNELSDVIDMLGDNPYDMAQKCDSTTRQPSIRSYQPGLPRRQTTPSNISRSVSRPRSVMDDETASNFARVRSQWHNERNSRHSFDDRGGIPGRWPFTKCTSEDAPPLPPMPTEDEINRRFSYRGGYATHPGQMALEGQQSSDIFQSDGLEEAPLPPPHSPRPSFVDHPDHHNDIYDEPEYFETDHYDREESPVPPFNNEQYDREESPAPPPPCHSPRPLDIEEHEVNWAGPASVWADRRKSASAALHQSWNDQSEPEYLDYEHDQYRHLQHDQYYDSQHNYDYDRHFPEQQTAKHHDSYHRNQYVHQHQRQPLKHYPQHSPVPAHSYDDQYRSPTNHYDSSSPQRFYANYNQQVQPPSPHTIPRRPLPQPQHQAHPQSRPVSRHSHISHTSHNSRKSLAEELHPELDSSPPRPVSSLCENAPHIGRYSGGLEYNYDRHTGFDGSTGTRSTSTAQVKNKTRGRDGWLDMQSYGVDFGDVPVMRVPVGVTGSRMVYQ